MKFVRARPWDGASSLRSRSFLSKLAQLMNARNRMAHLGDLGEEEFEQLLSFMVDGERPGEFFQALGVGEATS